MAVFIFKAVDESGKEFLSELEAESLDGAREQITAKGLQVIAIKEKAPRKAAPLQVDPSKKKARVFGGVNKAQLTQFTVQLATLVDAGVPLPRSLAILESQTKVGVLRNHLMDVSEDVETGSSLSDALSKHPKVFDTLFVNMVKAGQLGGVLDKVLHRLSEFMEKSQRLRRRVVGASIYPAMVALVAITILTLIMIFVVPKFTTMFAEQDIPLPGPTIALMTISKLAVDLKFVIPAIPVLFYGIFVFIKRSEGGRMFLDRLKLKIPLTGNVIRKATIARFTRTLGTLDASGVDILDALRICRDAIGNSVLAEAINNVHDAIREGESIAAPLGESGLFTELVVNMVAVGEETGRLSEMLLKVADVYDEEVDAGVEAMTSAMEPLLILFMGGAVAFIVFALFMPMIKILEAAQENT